jgi:hypothetical protein
VSRNPQTENTAPIPFAIASPHWAELEAVYPDESSITVISNVPFNRLGPLLHRNSTRILPPGQLAASISAVEKLTCNCPLNGLINKFHGEAISDWDVSTIYAS